jgi:hypothetical protein
MASCSDDDPSGSGGEATTAAETTGQGSTSTGPDPFAQCKKGVIEDDFVHDPWVGPGVDPMTGEIAPGSYRVATTYLALKPEKMQRFHELSDPVVETLFTAQGLVAVTTGSSQSCSALRTFTVWQTEEDMYAFVGSAAHAAAMPETSDLSRGTSNTISWDGDETTATWEEATSRLAAETTGDR